MELRWNLPRLRCGRTKVGGDIISTFLQILTRMRVCSMLFLFLFKENQREAQLSRWFCWSCCWKGRRAKNCLFFWNGGKIWWKRTSEERDVHRCNLHSECFSRTSRDSRTRRPPLRRRQCRRQWRRCGARPFSRAFRAMTARPTANGAVKSRLMLKCAFSRTENWEKQLPRC